MKSNLKNEFLIRDVLDSLLKNYLAGLDEIGGHQHSDENENNMSEEKRYHYS